MRGFCGGSSLLKNAVHCLEFKLKFRTKSSRAAGGKSGKLHKYIHIYTGEIEYEGYINI